MPFNFNIRQNIITSKLITFEIEQLFVLFLFQSINSQKNHLYEFFIVHLKSKRQIPLRQKFIQNLQN